MAEVLPYVAIAFAGLSFLSQILEKVFGGGNALAAKFHKLDKETSLAISVVRTELMLRVDGYEDNAGTGFETIKNNIHAMQLGLLEFRAKIADELHLYIRKDDYNAGVSEIKRDVQDGFRNMNDRMGQLQDLITWANPDIPNRPVHPKSHI